MFLLIEYNTEQNYLCANQEMIWILDYFSKSSKDPNFLTHSLYNAKCKVSSNVIKYCRELKNQNEFNCDESGIHLNIIHM